jgi:hypothetical protein
MAQNVGACVAFGLMLAACGVGDTGGGDTQPDASSDDPDIALGITCRAAFNLTGTMTPGTPTRPLDPATTQPITGCWPVGTWSFTATVDTTTMQTHPCTTPPTVLPKYEFRVDRTQQTDGSGLVESYTYLGDMAMLGHLKVSEGGGGECEAGLELWSIDNKMFWNMKPDLTQTTIAGHGDFAVYKDAQLR